MRKGDEGRDDDEDETFAGICDRDTTVVSFVIEEHAYEEFYYKMREKYKINHVECNKIEYTSQLHSCITGKSIQRHTEYE